MTKTSVEILGLPVISITEGRELGISKTLVIDARRGAVAAITIEDEDWYRGVKLLPYASVIAIGHDAVTVTSSESILTLEEASDFEAMLDANIRIIGTKAITKTGTINGKVVEVFIDGNGVVEKIRIAAPDGTESEILADEISIFGKQVTVIGEPGEGAERKREAEHFTYTHVPKPKAKAAPEPEPIMEEAPEIVPEPPGAFAEKAGLAPEPEPPQEAEPGIAPEPSASIEPEPTAEMAETVEIEIPQVQEVLAEAMEPAPAPDLPEMVEQTIVPEPSEPGATEAAQEQELPEVIEPEIVPEFMGSRVTETASAPEPEIVPAPPKEEMPAPTPEPAEEPAPKPKTRRGRPKKAAASASESTEESASKPRTRRGRPKKTAESAPEPTEELVLELESEPEPKKKPGARAKKTAAAEPEKSEADANATLNRQRRFLLGKKAVRDIATDSGVVVAKAGDEITEEILQKAQITGKLIELSMNVQ